MNKAILLERLQNERDHFEMLLNRVGFARQLAMRGVAAGLTIKDLVAQVLLREQFIADRLSEILHGETYAPSASFTALERFQQQYGYPDYESSLIEKNGHDLSIVEAYRQIELDEIVSQELAVYSNILEAIAKLTPHEFLDHDLYHRIAEHTYRPYRQTIMHINRWLKKNASETKR
ncbi:MAG: hypothetical protein HXY38_09815 [Chloroflexi bacterium]|nr:hypothetical protein [Chloroflexota bacterium]